MNKKALLLAFAACLAPIAGSALAEGWGAPEPTPAADRRAAALDYITQNCMPMQCLVYKCETSYTQGDACSWIVTHRWPMLVERDLRLVEEPVERRIRFELGSFVPDALPDPKNPERVVITCSRFGCISQQIREGTRWTDEGARDEAVFTCTHPSVASRAATALDILVESCGGAGGGELFEPKF